MTDLAQPQPGREGAALLPLGGAVAAACLVMAGIIIAAGPEPAHRQAAVVETTAAARLALRFEDRPDGTVAVYRDGVDAVHAVIPAGTNHFMRATLRGLASERKRRHLDDQAPFELTAWSDGRITLADPATDRRIELEAFGATNAQAFAALFKGGAP